MLRLPIRDYRMPAGPKHVPFDQIKAKLEGMGFVFSGETDQEERQEVTLPDGWTTEGDTGLYSHHWIIKNQHGRAVMEVRRKRYYGGDMISFVMVESFIFDL